ncbi:MAG TPA: response regulator [Actinomycetota bacterium]|nr:response regulator [Actinomycetota bacterium]
MKALHVLVVEDDADHLFLIRRALADMGGTEVTVEVAGDGEQAVERLARSRFGAGGRPQLVLLDLKMPRMDGLEVLRRIRADPAAADLPVVVLTSSERQEDREAAVAGGATWFVCKPIDGRRFRSEIQQLADRWAVPA